MYWLYSVYDGVRGQNEMFTLPKWHNMIDKRHAKVQTGKSVSPSSPQMQMMQCRGEHWVLATFKRATHGVRDYAQQCQTTHSTGMSHMLQRDCTRAHIHNDITMTSSCLVDAHRTQQHVSKPQWTPPELFTAINQSRSCLSDQSFPATVMWTPNWVYKHHSYKLKIRRFHCGQSMWDKNHTSVPFEVKEKHCVISALLK